MASKKNRARASKDAAPRKYKKKTSALVIEKVDDPHRSAQLRGRPVGVSQE